MLLLHTINLLGFLFQSIPLHNLHILAWEEVANSKVTKVYDGQ